MTLDINRSTSLESIFKRDVKLYKKTVSVKAVQVHEFFAVFTSGCIIHGDAGDYVCEDIDGEKWIVKKKTFEKTHDEIK